MTLAPSLNSSPAVQVSPGIMKQTQAIPAVLSPNLWSRASMSIIKCILGLHHQLGVLCYSGDDWNTPNLPSCGILDDQVDNFFSFYLTQLVISFGTEAQELSSYFHPVEPRCWWYACEMSNLLKHKSSPLILISCCSEFPRSIVCSGEKSTSFYPF